MIPPLISVAKGRKTAIVRRIENGTTEPYSPEGRPVMESEALPRAAHAEHITEALRRSGALGKGRVRDVMVENSRPTLLSRIIRLRLSYEGATDAPRALILKTGLPGRASEVGWRGA